MVDPNARLARTVLADNLRVRKGESVVIESWSHTLPFLRAFVGETRRLGAHPTVLFEDEGAWWDAVRSKHLKGFARLSEPEKGALEGADAFVYFWGPDDRVRLDSLPDALQEELTGFNEEWYRVARKSGLRGCRMMVGQATDPAAKALGLKGPEWRERMVAAGSLSAEALRRKGRAVADRLADGRELRIRHSNGTDLRMKLSTVHTRVDSGLLDTAAMKRPYGMLANNPSGQVLAAIDDGSAEGVVVSNRPVYMGYDKFAGQRWTFSDGRLVARTMGAGKSVFESQFRKAPKGKDQLGLVALGLNPLARGLVPLEDAEEGAALIGIGNNGFVGGKTRIPFQGFSLLAGATVEVDGRAIARAGRIL